MVSFLHVLLPSLCFIGSNSYRLVPKSTLEPTTFTPFEFLFSENDTLIDGVVQFVNDSVMGPNGYEMVTYFMFGKKRQAYWVINLSRYPSKKLMCGGFQMTNVTTNFTVYFNWEIIDKPIPGNEYPPKARNLTWKTYPLNTQIYHPKWKLTSDTFRQTVKFKGRKNGEWYYFFGSTVIKGGTENHTVIVEDLTKEHTPLAIWNLHAVYKRSLDNEYKEMMKANENKYEELMKKDNENNKYEESMKEDNENNKYEESMKEDNENNKYEESMKKDKKNKSSTVEKRNAIRNFLKRFGKEKCQKKLVKAAKWVRNVFNEWFKRPLKAATKRAVKRAVRSGVERAFELVQSQLPAWISYILLKRPPTVWRPNYINDEESYEGADSSFRDRISSFRDMGSSSRDRGSSSKDRSSSSKDRGSSSRDKDSSKHNSYNSQKRSDSAN